MKAKHEMSAIISGTKNTGVWCFGFNEPSLYMGSPSLLTSHVELLGDGNLSVTTLDYAIVFTSFTYKTNNSIYLQGEIFIL